MKALILAADGAEDCELLYPLYRFREAGIEADVADNILVGGEVGAVGKQLFDTGRSFRSGQAEAQVLVFGKPALGTPVHASIAGTVTAIDQGIVWIENV